MPGVRSDLRPRAPTPCTGSAPPSMPHSQDRVRLVFPARWRDDLRRAFPSRRGPPQILRSADPRRCCGSARRGYSSETPPRARLRDYARRLPGLVTRRAGGGARAGGRRAGTGSDSLTEIRNNVHRRDGVAVSHSCATMRPGCCRGRRKSEGGALFSRRCRPSAGPACPTSVYRQPSRSFRRQTGAIGCRCLRSSPRARSGRGWRRGGDRRRRPVPRRSRAAVAPPVLRAPLPARDQQDLLRRRLLEHRSQPLGLSPVPR